MLKRFLRRLIRRRVLMRGVFGGDRLWLTIGGVIWTRRKIKELLGRGEPEPVYTEEVEPGERVVMVHSESTSRRRRRGN